MCIKQYFVSLAYKCNKYLFENRLFLRFSTRTHLLFSYCRFIQWCSSWSEGNPSEPHVLLKSKTTKTRKPLKDSTNKKKRPKASVTRKTPLSQEQPEKNKLSPPTTVKRKKNFKSQAGHTKKDVQIKHSSLLNISPLLSLIGLDTRTGASSSSQSTELTATATTCSAIHCMEQAVPHTFTSNYIMQPNASIDTACHDGTVLASTSSTCHSTHLVTTVNSPIISYPVTESVDKLSSNCPTREAVAYPHSTHIGICRNRVRECTIPQPINKDTVLPIDLSQDLIPLAQSSQTTTPRCDKIESDVTLTQLAANCNLSADRDNLLPQESERLKNANSLVAEGVCSFLPNDKSVYVPAGDTLNSPRLVSKFDNQQQSSQNNLGRHLEHVQQISTTITKMELCTSAMNG